MSPDRWTGRWTCPSVRRRRRGVRQEPGSGLSAGPCRPWAGGMGQEAVDRCVMARARCRARCPFRVPGPAGCRSGVSAGGGAGLRRGGCGRWPAKPGGAVRRPVSARGGARAVGGVSGFWGRACRSASPSVARPGVSQPFAPARPAAAPLHAPAAAGAPDLVPRPCILCRHPPRVPPAHRHPLTARAPRHRPRGPCPRHAPPSRPAPAVLPGSPPPSCLAVRRRVLAGVPGGGGCRPVSSRVGGCAAGVLRVGVCAGGAVSGVWGGACR
ncbi:hypothetical protein FHS34_007359 [Streptomyces echinatus]|uniref:Uncharacterized protein n=1 Tax=Streptomyces echinatus TaxID=67293 RepID=A0A7W9Q1F8_9ACTN|nr:hypothetical protein [Streptomyces echinatus]